MKIKKLIIIDASSLIYRAFYAVPPIKDKQGELSNAVYGFISIFLKVVKDLKPDFIVVAYDVKGPIFRHQEFKDYKANRAKTPDELILQIPKIKKFVKSLGVKSFEKSDFEADDIIGTISTSVSISTSNAGLKTIIVSGDRDSFQLINETTVVQVPKTGSNGIIYDRERVIEKYQGITPEQFPDFRALVGDPSDNIPGVKGIGEKTAIKLINEFENLENLYDEIDKKQTKISDSILAKLIKDKEKAFFSRKLSTIKKDVEIDFNLAETDFTKCDFEKAIIFIEELGFRGLIKNINNNHINANANDSEKCQSKKKSIETKTDQQTLGF